MEPDESVSPEETPEPTAEVKPKRVRARVQKPLSVAELCEQGERRLNGHRKAQARESFTRAAELDPQCEAAWMGLAVAAATEADRQAALRRVLEVNPENATARNYLDRVEQQAREAAERQAEYEAFRQRIAEQQRISMERSRPQQSTNSHTVAWAVGILLSVIVLFYGIGAWSAQVRRSEELQYQQITYATPIVYATPIPYSGGSICADGWHSSSTGRGACSHHGGVVGH